MDPGYVKRAIAARLSRVRHCYADALQRDPTLAGLVRVQLTIDPAGTLAAASVVANGTGDETVGGCVLDGVRAARFPPSDGGSEEFRVGIRLRLTNATVRLDDVVGGMPI